MEKITDEKHKKLLLEYLPYTSVEEMSAATGYGKEVITLFKKSRKIVMKDSLYDRYDIELVLNGGQPEELFTHLKRKRHGRSVTLKEIEFILENVATRPRHEIAFLTGRTERAVNMIIYRAKQSGQQDVETSPEDCGFYTTIQVAEMLGVSSIKVHNDRKAGKITPAEKTGRVHKELTLPVSKLRYYTKDYVRQKNSLGLKGIRQRFKMNGTRHLLFSEEEVRRYVKAVLPQVVTNCVFCDDTAIGDILCSRCG